MFKLLLFRAVLPVMLIMFMTTGAAFAAVTTLSTTGLTFSAPSSVAVDVSGNIYVADTKHNQVVKLDSAGETLLVIGDSAALTGGFFGDGAIASGTTLLNAPTGVALDTSGNLYIADTGNNRIRKVLASDGKISTVGGNGGVGFSGDDVLATASYLNSPTSVAVDTAGTIYVLDNKNYRIRKIEATTKKISTIIGDGNPATFSAFRIILSPAGDLYIADPSNNKVSKITANNGLIDSKTLPVIMAGTGVAGHSGDGGLATLATLNQPSGLATDGSVLYIADTGNNCVRMIYLATGVISTRAGTALHDAEIIGTFYAPLSIAVNSAGNIYVADTKNNVIKIVEASNFANTTASPISGTYSTAQLVTLKTTNMAVDSIYYTTDGTIPDTTLTAPTTTTKYSVPFTIAPPIFPITFVKLKYTSVDLDGIVEPPNTVTYTFDTTAPVTTATINSTPVSTIYYSALSALTVTLSSPGAKTIYYSINGLAPTTKYTLPISIPVTATKTTTTLRYYAVDDFDNKETEKTVKYAVLSLASTASVIGGTYTSAQTVTLSANNSASSIYYLATVAGTEPTVLTGTMVASGTAIPAIASSIILKYFAVDPDNNSETVKTQEYVIDTVVPVTTASVPSGSYTAIQTVNLSASKPATIYYTLDAKDPTLLSTKYTAPIVISKTTTLKFFARDTATNQEAIQTRIYTIDTVAPVTTASVLSGTFASIQAVTLTADDSNAKIYYTTDGSVPTASSQKYSSPLLINKTTTLKYFGLDSVGNEESVKEQTYTIIQITTTAYPSGGSFASSQTVTLTSNSPGAAIYYTKDGTTPTKSSTRYTAPILVTDTTNTASTTTVLQFFAIDKLGIIESLRSETYLVDVVVPITVAKCIAAVAPALTTIKLSTTDSSDPTPQVKYIANTATTENGVSVAAYTLTDYAFPIEITANTIVKFFAIDAAGNTEQIKTAYCPIAASTVPSIYLETLTDTDTTNSTNVYATGIVAPFTTTTLTINGATVSTDTKDGSFSYNLPAATLPVAPAVPLALVATNGVDTIAVNRVISVGVPLSSIEIGASIGVVGNLVRVPITLKSGYQASAVNIDIGYNALKLSLPRAELAPGIKTLNKVIVIGSSPLGNFRLAILDKAGNSLTPLPDGIVAYVTFAVSSGSGTTDTLANTSVAADRAADIGGAIVTTAVINGSVKITDKAGDSDTDSAVSLKEVMDALLMMIDPVAHPVVNVVDLDADGKVSISEFQRVINTFVGL